MFISVLLALGATMFEKDAQLLVLQPIERMTEKVRILAENPFASEEALRKNAMYEVEDESVRME